MRTRYHTLELGIGLAGLVAAPVCGALALAPVRVPIPDLFKWAGLVLLAQGLARDVVLLAVYKVHRTPAPTTQPGVWLCLESTLGAGLVGLFLLLLALGAQGVLTLSAQAAVLLLALAWLFGYATRDVIVELRRDPNHLQLLVGFRPKAD